MTKDNLVYWNISKDNPEPLIDEYYLIDKEIAKHQLEAIKELRQLLKTICENQAFQDEELLKKLVKSLNQDGVQYTEFIAFMNAFDVSLSTFKKWETKEKVDALKVIVKNYCEKRYKIYKSEGDDIKIPRAMVDKGASKRKTEAGKEKIKTIMKEFNFEEAYSSSELLSKQNAYLDINHHEQEFEKLKQTLRIKKRFDKKPDLIVKIGNHILIIEAKHIKESGGGQDKSILELCNFISYEETKQSEFTISYVAFLDGIYANKFFNMKHQYSARAREALASCKNNYFVNTAGFMSLVRDLLMK